MLENRRTCLFYGNVGGLHSLMKVAMKVTQKGLTLVLVLQLPLTSYVNWTDHDTLLSFYTKVFLDFSVCCEAF